ncbi:MAG: dephospho-CoA kinase [Clostridia bacterium]|nr:dephospho-CoA kinase [Clostridia bacterium]
MIIIGVTGPSGAGKGAVSEYLSSKYGFQIIDADKVYHGIISAPSDCVNELTEYFGKEILNECGGIDRRALSRFVFGEENKDKLLHLNKITHKFVISEINRLLSKYSCDGVEVCVIDAPLLIEAGINEMCDRVIAVVADKELRAERISRRDGIDKEAALLRINSQKPDSFYKENCDCLLSNDLCLKELGILVDQFIKCEGLIK